jgi:hypothetical protein
MSNEEIPTTVLDNGNEATVIAGAVNHHLSIRKAMGCYIARAYFVKAFTALSTEDQNAFIEANDLKDLAIITAFVVEDLGGFFTSLSYMSADSTTDAIVFTTIIAQEVADIIGETDEANENFALELENHYIDKWEKLVEEDKKK